MKKHNVYLFKQVFSDGRLMYARWSPTINRKEIKPFQAQDDNATAYLEYFGWPEIDQLDNPRLIPSIPFEVIDVEDSHDASR